MEKKLNFYETLFVVSPALSEDETKAVIEKFTALIAENGSIISVNEWGKRRLAYPIEKFTEGYYVVVNFQSEGNFPAELERLFGINDSVIRSMVIRLEKAPAVKEEPKETVEAVEAPAEEPAPTAEIAE
jgi:small subunit ribosomal protein S6